MRMMTIVVIRMYMRSVFSCSRFLFVSAGKWAYEVLISSQGLMQIGWCTLYCRFNQEVTFIVLLFKVLVILMKQLWRQRVETVMECVFCLLFRRVWVILSTLMLMMETESGSGI